MPHSPASSLPWDIWFQAAKRQEVHQSLVALWTNLADEIAQRPDAVCQASGRCCRFEEFGHRLYVTGLEIAWVVEQYRQSVCDAPDGLSQGLDASIGGCLFQIDRQCSIHRIRPLGCRIFFCTKSSDAWQHDLYEKKLAVLRHMHDELAIPYAYMEWRQGLSQALPYPR